MGNSVRLALAILLATSSVFNADFINVPFAQQSSSALLVNYNETDGEPPVPVITTTPEVTPTTTEEPTTTQSPDTLRLVRKRRGVQSLQSCLQ